MSFRETLSLIKSVVVSPEVIGTAIIILLFLNMVFYVASYKKRGRKKGRRKSGSALSRAGMGGEGGVSGEGEFHL